MEIDKVCRICLRTSNDLKSIFDFKCEGVPILEIVRKVCHNLRYVPYENDSMPSLLCSSCIAVLSQAHQLNQTSLKSENQLQSTLCLPDPLRVKEEYVDLGPSVSISHLGGSRQTQKDNNLKISDVSSIRQSIARYGMHKENDEFWLSIESAVGPVNQFFKALLNQNQLASHVTLTTFSDDDLPELFKEIEDNVKQTDPDSDEMKELKEIMPNLKTETFKVSIGFKATVKSIIAMLQQYSYEDFRALQKPSKRARMSGKPEENFMSSGFSNSNLSSSDDNQMLPNLNQSIVLPTSPPTELQYPKKNYRSVKSLLLEGRFDIKKEWTERLLQMVRNCVDPYFSSSIDLFLEREVDSEQFWKVKCPFQGCFSTLSILNKPTKNNSMAFHESSFRCHLQKHSKNRKPATTVPNMSNMAEDEHSRTSSFEDIY